jgi:O-antigen/teichoic acid export membrane protein
MGSVDILMLGYFCSADVVGIYSIALRIAILISFILYSFNDILLPVISEKFIERDFAEIKYLYQTITKWIFSLSLLFCGLIYTLHNDILLLFGKEYLPATIPLLILCIGQLVNSSVGGVGILLVVMGHQKLVLLNALILLTLNIILNYIFIARLNLNMMGAALATSISIILSNVVRLLELKILRNMQPFNLKYLKVIISFIPAFLITNVLLNMIDTWFVWRILSGVIIFTSTNALIYYFLGITEEDRFIFEKVRGKLWTEKI